ncbi:MAG: insulinase family protein [Ruthenibacterium sp.]
MNRREIAPGVFITNFAAAPFKRCRITINFLWAAHRETATAEALLPLVLERGYAGCPDMTALSKKLAALYGAALSVDSTLSGANRVLTVSVAGIRDAFALAGENLTAEYAKIALGTAFTPYFIHGQFDPEAVEIEKEQLKELLEGEINEKRSYCVRQARRKFFGSAPAGIERSGYLEEVDDITPEDLTNVFQTMLQNAQIEVMVLGTNADIVCAELLGMLAGVCRTPAHLRLPEAMPRVEEQVFVQPLDTVQGKLCLLFTSGTIFKAEDLSALRVAVSLLGATATSRLFTNVREKKSLCYYCSASFVSLCGMLSIDSGVEHANAAAAKQAILNEFSMLCTGEITSKEMEETKRSLISSLCAVEDSLMGIESWYFAEMIRGTDKTPADVVHEIALVTPDDVRRVLSAFTLSVSYLLTKEDAQ